MKKTVYLDATIPSYLFDERESIRLQVRFSIDLELQPSGECEQAPTYPHHQRTAQSTHA